MHLLWADPFDSNEMGDNQSDDAAEPLFIFGGRGAYIKNFNWKALHEFLKENKLKFIIRAHQLVKTGYNVFGKNKGITLFSAPNYCGNMNASAVLEID